MSTSPFTATLTALARHRGVLGSIVVSERDGLPIDAIVQVGVNADVVAALAASLHRRARLSCAAAGYGDTRFVRLDAERGSVLSASHGDLVFVAITEGRANTGLLRVELLRAARGAS